MVPLVPLLAIASTFAFLIGGFVGWGTKKEAGAVLVVGGITVLVVDAVIVVSWFIVKGILAS